MEMAILSDISNIAELGATLVLAVIILWVLGYFVIKPLINSITDFSQSVSHQAEKTEQLARETTNMVDRIHSVQKDIKKAIENSEERIIHEIKKNK